MQLKPLSWSRGLFLASIVLVLVLFIPTAWFPFQLGKLALFTLLVAGTLILFTLGGGGRELMRAHGLRAALLVLLLPLVYFVSSFFSIDPAIAFMGSGVDADTIAFTAIASLAFILSFVLFRTLRTHTLLTKVVFWTLAGVTAFQLLVILFGTSLVPLSVFSDRSVNLIGKWNDLGLGIGLLLMFVIAHLELSPMTLVRRSIYGGVAAVLVLLLAIINFGVAWGFLLGFSIALALVVFFLEREGRGASSHNSFLALFPRATPWFAIATGVVSVVFIFFGSGINASITSVLPVTSLEVRPSYTSTLDVMNASQEGSLGRVALGTGPNTFSENWIMHKPAEVNQSLFWNLDFAVGFSTLLTALGTVGILGLLAWLIPLFLVLASLVRAIRLGVLSREERTAAILGSIGSVFLMSSIIFYVPSQSLIILTFVLCGATFGFLWRQGRSNAHEEGGSSSRAHALGGMGLAVALLVASFFLAGVTDRRFIAEAFVGKGSVALNEGNVESGLSYAQRAYATEKIPDALLLVMNASTLRLQQLAQDTTTPAEQIQAQFTSTVEGAVAAGQEAIALSPNDYRPYVALGRVYDLLTQLKVTGAYDEAKKRYDEAIVRNPNNPQLPLALARLEAVAGNREASGQQLVKALTLKSNYTDAILFDVQLRVADNDIPNAIRSATAAVQTAPGVASIWFELGLLYYAAGDTVNAIPPLEQAIILVPDYANAKYFLGLSYYAQKKSNEALSLFQNLVQTNPDNQEVKLILTNMAAGRDPFASSTPPVIPPEDRPTAPISQ
ncbi:tetratricopeptide repeat protein [Acetobacteraceae bacterium]|nr:tetratricopeptide repeat protein [Candidatus Parcubacteria bacterium]